MIVAESSRTAAPLEEEVVVVAAAVVVGAAVVVEVSTAWPEPIATLRGGGLGV